MTASRYLKNIADGAVLSDDEKTSLGRSMTVLQQRLATYFGADVKEHFRFGSFDRGTILPRYMDERSDVDYMVVFSDNSFRPQTYLDKLNRFVSAKYHSSEVTQSHPTIQLELSHIRFELVPAIRTWFSGLQIPQRDGLNHGWMDTDPKDFNATIVEKNGQHKFLIKPLVRLVKYWNACNGYPFASYDLEQKVVAKDYGMLGFWMPDDLKGYFFEFMLNLPEYGLAQSKQDKIQRAKRIIEETKRLESQGHWTFAESEIQKLVPDPLAKKLSARRY